MAKHKCKCPHAKIDFGAYFTADGHKQYVATCIKCKKDLDPIAWLIDKVKELMGQ